MTSRPPKRDPLGEIIRAAGRRPSPPAEHYLSVLAASRSAWLAKVRARRRRRFGYALAASLALVAVVTATFRALDSPAPVPVATSALAVGDVTRFAATSGAWEPVASPDAKVFAGDRVRTGPDGRATFEIGDGAASLRIDSQTELRLTRVDRFELIAGRVYIDSGDGPLDSIEIATVFGTVRDIGTQFEVQSTAQALRVRVRSGSVALVDSPHTADLRRLAGDELELSSSGAVAVRRIAPDDEQWLWAAALAVVADRQSESILGYFRWIARETGKSLRFDSESTELRAQLERWSGDPQGLTPIQVLDAIVATSDFVYEFAEDGTMLVGRR